MEQMIHSYIQYLIEMKQVSTNTIEAYASDLKQLNQYAVQNGIKDIHMFTETNINSFLLALEAQGYSPATINRKLVTIKKFILFGIKKGLIHNDVTERIRPPKFEKKLPMAISVEQVEALINAPDVSTNNGLRDKALFELLYATGIKVSELIVLKKSDIMLKYNYIVVHEKAGERLVPFGNAAKEAITAYFKCLEEETKKNCEEGNDILFQNRFQKALTRQGFWKILKDYADKIGLKESITPQIIRNSFAIHMLQNGADLYSMKELMGHGDISVTRRYMNVKPGKTMEVYRRTHPRGN